MFIDKKFVDSLILGSVLGDGYVSNGKYPNISFTQNRKDNKEINYIKLKYNSISKYYKTNQIRNQHNNTIVFSISSTEKELTSFMSNITRYEDNKRKLPDIKYIDPVVMLFWYLDDGSLSIGKQLRRRKNKINYTISRRLKITLQSYRDEDILKFIKDFKDKFNIDFHPLRENGKISSISLKKIEEIIKFLDLINPYKDLIPEEQQYKFCMCILDKNLNQYNNCNVIKTGICTCRNKKLNFLDRYNFNDHS